MLLRRTPACTNFREERGVSRQVLQERSGSLALVELADEDDAGDEHGDADDEETDEDAAGGATAHRRRHRAAVVVRRHSVLTHCDLTMKKSE